MEPLYQIALTFFLVTNPVGNSPAILALLKDFPFERQRKIMIREGFFALILALFFQYFGEHFLDLLNIKGYAVSLCGGTLLFLVSLEMIFSMNTHEETQISKQEPFIVPIATPLLSGAGLLSIIMLKSHETQNTFLITASILIAWVGVIGVMAGAPYLQKIVGKRGLIALEQLMGLILAMISIELLLNGALLFKKTLV